MFEPSGCSNATVYNARLLRAAREGDIVLLQEALDAGANLETRQPLRLMTAQVANRADRAADEQSHQHSCDRWFPVGLTALMHAARGGHLTCVMALLEARAAVEAKDEDGATALHLAASSGDLDVFKALVLAGADGTARDGEKRTPLDYLPEAIRAAPDEESSWRAVLHNELPTAALAG